MHFQIACLREENSEKIREAKGRRTCITRTALSYFPLALSFACTYSYLGCIVPTCS